MFRGNYLQQIVTQIVSPSIGKLKFAYHKGRSIIEDAIIIVLNFYQHLVKQGSYTTRALFIDFSLAFNTMLPNELVDKLKKYWSLCILV